MRLMCVPRLFLLALLLAALLPATACEGRAQLFAEPVALPVAGEPMSVTMADLRGTGWTDAVVLEPGGTVEVLLRGAAGGWSRGASIAVGVQMAGDRVVVADADRDGWPDLVWVAPGVGGATLMMARGLGDGTFGPARQMGAFAFTGEKAARVGWMGALASGAPGYLDLLVEDVANGVMLDLRSDGSGVLLGETQVMLPHGAGPVAVAKVDGRAEVVVAGAGAVDVLRADGAGGLVVVGNVSLDGVLGTARAVAVGDVDGDGRADVVVLADGVGGSRVAVLAGAADGGFGAATVWQTGGSYGLMELVTVPGEGRSAVLLGGDAGVALLRGADDVMQVLRGVAVEAMGVGDGAEVVVAGRGGVLSGGGAVWLGAAERARPEAAGAGLAATAVVLTGTTAVITYGQSFGGMATVSAATGDAMSGTVSFLDNGQALCTAGAAPANCPAVAGYVFGAGTHAITATYSGDGTHAASSSAAMVLLVLKNSVSATVRNSSGEVTVGDAVTLTAVLTGSYAVPSGSVTFVDAGSGAVLGTAALDASGVAALTTAGLGAGTFAVEAVYGETAGFLGATSAPVTVVVSAPVVVEPEFTVVAAAGGMTVGEGGSAAVGVSVAPAAGWSGTVLLGCDGLPVGASCTFAKSEVATGETTTLGVATTTFVQCGDTAAVGSAGIGGTGWGAVGAALVGMIGGWLLWPGRRGRLGFAVLGLLAVLAAGVTGCGRTCTPGGTAPGTYAIQVTGRAQSLNGTTSTVVVSQKVLVTVTR